MPLVTVQDVAEKVFDYVVIGTFSAAPITVSYHLTPMLY